MNKLVLFDIDNTLIKSSKVKDSIAFPEAFKKVYGVEASINDINAHGMTDQQIIIELMKLKGIDEHKILSKLKDCMQTMIDSFNRVSDQDEVVLLDGVKELLSELESKGFIIGLVTGNLEPIARGKLKKAGINHYFKVGGFGNEDINRVNLVKLAIKKSEERFGFKFNKNVFLFGDTPQDVKSGKAAGATAIGVTTGIYSKEQLKEAGADYIFENLEDTNKILDILIH